MRAVFTLHVFATFALFGLIAVVQLVHYPLFARVGADGFAAYEAEHARRITWIVAPLMLAELGTALLLLLDRPAWIPAAWALAGLGLVGVVWATTLFVSVPLHNRLALGFDAPAHARLVATNWIRTAAWTLRAGGAAWLLWSRLGAFSSR